LLSLCCFQGESAVNWYPVFSSWLSTPLHLNPWDYFLWWYLKDRVLQKSLHTIPEPKTAIQSEIEAISMETTQGSEQFCSSFAEILWSLGTLYGADVIVTKKFTMCIIIFEISYSCI
jgi:hypothetical protein